MKKLAVLTAKPEFTAEIMAKASSVAAVLTDWVLSVERYHKTKESCKIKMSELEAAKEMVEGLQNEEIWDLCYVLICNQSLLTKEKTTLNC